MTRNHPQPSRRAALLGGAALTALAVTAGTGTAHANSSTTAASWPTEFPLPNGWLPEGIAIGSRPYAYLGSRADGAIYRTDLRTGEGKVLSEGATGLVSVGLKLDHDGLLYVAGSTGAARVVDSRTGEILTTYQLTAATGHFINDITLLGDRAWFTDSLDAVLYGVPRGRTGEVAALPLTGDWVQTPGVNNANGIVGTPDGHGLIVVSSSPGKLYRVSLKTGYATEIALSGASDVANGDGLFRIGRTLYVVQNRLNRISVFDLDAEVTTATLRTTITDPRFDVPTTAARFGNRLYLVNARFTTPQTPDTTFTAVAVSL
ncbi:SMP-30/gluconolactonase/LRE family protein [Streptomyces hokutonensis]|uniref:SMP-30/gluconolactonase/LRE family protein n=1 Tax=Streptomyces hokutonensis TaxID=1306990 RepID=UPI00380764E7